MSCREEIVAELKRKLVGPGLGAIGADGSYEHETIDGRLSLAYMMGMLFPRMEEEDAALAGDEAEAPDDEIDDPLSMAHAMLPSSMGLSFCVAEGSSVQIRAKGARYEFVEAPKPGAKAETEAEGRRAKKNRDEKWRRRPLGDTLKLVTTAGSPSIPALEGHAELEVLARQLASGDTLLTVSLSNVAQARGRGARDTLFQTSISVEALEGQILPYPAAKFVPPTDDERELRVVYGGQRPYAVGHGVATSWTVSESRCTSITTDVLPTANVWRPIFDNLSVSADGDTLGFNDPDLFRIAPLTDASLEINRLCERLGALVAFYERWIDSQHLLQVEDGLERDAERMLSRCSQSASRMRAGIAVLRENSIAAKAFILANRAMLMAMSHAARITGRARADHKQGPFPLGEADTSAIDYFANDAKWRPFQLAFFLQILPSLAGEGLPDRELVDVIWFSTGGGKTEAYLLVSAFEMIRRRLTDGDAGGGTGIINRYTYRFLTADQFQRTAGVICALETIRSEFNQAGDHSLGSEEFSIGLFVGGEASPNSFDDADQKRAELLDANDPRASNPFPLESCPSCGTLLVPEIARRLDDGSPDLAFYGFSSTANSFRTFCPDEDCSFHTHLPIYFVDSQLYQSPPSFLLGTVDKFAMVPWNEKGGKFFGMGVKASAPSLIIQDELHLISGPLGTLAGIYEAAFETLVRTSGAPPPKVIASTATIRNAAVQCRRMYGRSSVVFPAPGLKAEDSFFSKLDVGNEDRSRLYAGVMAQGLRSTVAASWTIAAILQAVFEMAEGGQASDDEVDAFWTLVAYHNSKRELGRITNATRDEIPTRLKVYAHNPACERPSQFEVMELKAHSEIPVPQARQKLGRRHTKEEPAIDIVPCTNIISVGVDIDRLGLMFVNGQPKLSAEYIQATSRVGRGKVPGLVLTCYSPSKPRDRSHYESFRDYHERFYSFVEPTSVTPGALPAIERALHAALTIVVRHGCDLRKNSDAARFDPTNAKVNAGVELLRKRLCSAYDGERDVEERDRLSAKLQEKIAEWGAWIKQYPDTKYRMAVGQKSPCLLVPFGHKKTDQVGWHTLQSMRHVDQEITLEDRPNAQTNRP